MRHAGTMLFSGAVVKPEGVMLFSGAVVKPLQ